MELTNVELLKLYHRIRLDGFHEKDEIHKLFLDDNQRHETMLNYQKTKKFDNISIRLVMLLLEVKVEIAMEKFQKDKLSISKESHYLIAYREVYKRTLQEFWGEPENWDVSNVTDMSDLFSSFKCLPIDISKWDVRNVTDMSGMFMNVKSFNQDISKWDVRNVTDMSGMFMETEPFNQDISKWDVSNVTNMRAMFQHAYKFNCDIGRWNVRNVTNMSRMLRDADSFNQKLNKWNVSNVTEMSHMLYYTKCNNEDIEKWDIGKKAKELNQYIYIS